MTMSILYERETANLGQIKKIITLVDGVQTIRQFKKKAKTIEQSPIILEFFNIDEK